ncbi:hypothetical protein L9F63_004023, partial [Diploptera punctata]
IYRRLDKVSVSIIISALKMSSVQSVNPSILGIWVSSPCLSLDSFGVSVYKPLRSRDFVSDSIANLEFHFCKHLFDFICYHFHLMSHSFVPLLQLSLVLAI